MPDITITQPALPADLPENWTNSQYVSAGGTETGLTQQHGYNYLMKQVNDAQDAVNTLASESQAALTELQKGENNATATRTGTTVAITGPANASTITFLAPADWTAGDSYTYNGQAITLTDLNGNPVENGWKQGAPVTLSISGTTGYFAAGASGDFLPLDGGMMTGPAIGAPGEDSQAQFRNISYGTTDLTPGVSDLPEGEMYLYLDPDDTGDPDGLLPPGGTNGQVLLKNGADNYSAKWGDMVASSQYGNIMSLNIAGKFRVLIYTGNTTEYNQGSHSLGSVALGGSTDIWYNALNNNAYIQLSNSTGGITLYNSETFTLGKNQVLGVFHLGW